MGKRVWSTLIRLFWMVTDPSPWAGRWTQARTDDESYEAVLSASGIPWAVHKLLQQFSAEREFVVSAGKPFLFRSKMLTGSWNELTPDDPTTFSVLGYSIHTLVTWENQGTTLVSTMRTTAEDGWLTSGWSTTTRITHELTEAGELLVTTIAPEGEYRMWMRRNTAPAP